MYIRATAAVAAVAFFSASPVLGAERGNVYGRVYPERNDDLSYENDVVAFRIYGPKTQRNGEKSFGYDIFAKYPDSGLVLPYLYGEQCGSANWAKADSLRKIDKELAKKFEESFTYHIDHGKGADFYAVGPTLGCGVAALLDADGKIQFPWCYDEVEIVENGPDRFEAKLSFAPVVIGSDTIAERRRLVLDKGSYLNYCEVSYEGLSHPYSIVAGVPRRDDGRAVMELERGVIAYEDPTQRKDSGKIFTGVIIPGGAEDMLEDQGHILAKCTIRPGETFRYYWGNGWSKGRIATMDEWIDYLNGFLASQGE
ncbi:MAG: DUF4861 domain-containing protein [Muribaculaceae bacterium]|nr:DUF4861 domain-containing protein [Muribaculaceae bacterium]